MRVAQVALIVAGLAHVSAIAQPASRPATAAAGSPMAVAPAPGAGGAASPAAAGGLSSPLGPGAGDLPPPGSGAGYHDPRSVFKPLQERDGVVSWKLLSAVKARIDKDRIIPEFPAAVQALNDRPVKVQGFMLPLEPGEKQKHFLLSAVPTTCSFCVPAGPEGLIEVRARDGVRYTVEAVTVEGRLSVLSQDRDGLFYRLQNARLEP